MTLRELQKLAHELRPYRDRIRRIASLTEVVFRATPEGIVVIAGWGTGQLQITLGAQDLCERPCDNSLRVAKQILAERLNLKETSDATGTTDPSGQYPGTD